MRLEKRKRLGGGGWHIIFLSFCCQQEGVGWAPEQWGGRGGFEPKKNEPKCSMIYPSEIYTRRPGFDHFFFELNYFFRFNFQPFGHQAGRPHRCTGTVVLVKLAAHPPPTLGVALPKQVPPLFLHPPSWPLRRLQLPRGWGR